MEFIFGNMSVINLKNDEISDEDSLESMILLLSEKKEKRINANNRFENNLQVENNKKVNNMDNIKSKINNLTNQKYLNDMHNNYLNLFTKEEEAKTKANTSDKNYSIKMDSIKSDINENEQIKNLSKDVYYKYNDDYKINYDNSDDKFDSDKFNNNCNYKIFEDNNYKKNINKNKNIKLLGKKREKVEKEDKICKTMNNENIFYDINKLYNNYNGKEKIYKLYENNKGFFDKNITIVEANIPICIIYFNHEIITKIYMIIEQTTFDKKDEILDILIKIKKNIQKKMIN